MKRKSLSKLLLLALATATVTTAMPNANYSVRAEEENADVVKFVYRYKNAEFFDGIEGSNDWNNIPRDKDITIKLKKTILNKNRELLINDGFVVEKIYNDGRVVPEVIENVNILKFSKEELKYLLQVKIILLEREFDKSYNVTISPEVKKHIAEKGLDFNDGTYSYLELDEKLYDLDRSKAYKEENTESTKVIRRLVVNYGGKDYNIDNISLSEDMLLWENLAKRKDRITSYLFETYMYNVINEKETDITIKFEYETKERTVITRILEADEVNAEEREEIEIIDYSKKSDDERLIFAVGGIEYFIKDDFAYFLDKVYVNGKEIDYKNPELYWYHKNGREYFATNFKKKFIEENGKTLRIKREYVKVKNSIKFKVEENSKELLKPIVSIKDNASSPLNENIGYDVYSLYRISVIGDGTLKDEELAKNYRIFYVFENGKEVELNSNKGIYDIDYSKYLTPEKENTIIIKAVPKVVDDKKDETPNVDTTKPDTNKPEDTNNKPETNTNPVVDIENEKDKDKYKEKNPIKETENKENKNQTANNGSKNGTVTTVKNPMPKTAVASVSALTALVSLAGAFVFRKRK